MALDRRYTRGWGSIYDDTKMNDVEDFIPPLEELRYFRGWLIWFHGEQLIRQKNNLILNGSHVVR